MSCVFLHKDLKTRSALVSSMNSKDTYANHVRPHASTGDLAYAIWNSRQLRNSQNIAFVLYQKCLKLPPKLLGPEAHGAFGAMGLVKVKVCRS